MRARRARRASAGRGGGLFVAYLALLVWLPIPLGSARPWSAALMEIGVYLLAALWLIRYARGRVVVTGAFRRARPALVLLALWLGYGLFQMLPLPGGVVATLSPHTAALYRLAHAAPLGAGQALEPNGDPNPLPVLETPAGPSNQAAAPEGPHEVPIPPEIQPLLDAGASTQGPSRLSLDLSASIAAWLESLAYVLVFALTLLLVDSPQRLRTLAYVLVLSGLGQAVYGALAVGIAGGGVATGSFVNRNHFAAYLVLCLATGIGLLIASMGHSSASSWRGRARRMGEMILSAKAPLRIALAIMVIALVLTHSRMGNSSFFAGMLIAGVAALILLRDTPRPVVLLIASLIVIDIVIIGSWVGIERVKERIAETTLAQETRDEVDRYSLRLWRDYPLFGTGAGSYYGVFPRYKQPDVGTSFYDHAHDDYLEFLSEYGALGVMPLGAVVGLALWSAARAQRLRRSGLMRGMGFASLMGIIALCLHASVEFNLHIPAYAATTMVILALAWLARYLAPGGRPNTTTGTSP